MRVTCLNELTEMMHSGYPGRAGRYKLSHIDFDKLEIPGVSDPVHQYIIQNTIKKSAVELATTNFLIGISPFILVDETYVIDGKNAKVKVPLILKNGTYDIVVSMDPNTTDSIFTVKIHGLTDKAKHPRVYVVRYQSCNGPSSVNGDVVDSPCGRLLVEYRKMKARLDMASMAFDKAIRPRVVVVHRPEAAGSFLSVSDIEAQAAELTSAALDSTLRSVDMTKSGYSSEKSSEIRLFPLGDMECLLLPKEYALGPALPTIPSEMYLTGDIIKEFSSLVDSEFMVSGVRSVDSGGGSRYMSSSVSDTMTANMRKSLSTVVDDVERGIKDIWKIAIGVSIEHIAIKIPYGRPLDLSVVAMLVEKNLFPIERAREQVSKIARFTVEDAPVTVDAIARPPVESAASTTINSIELPDIGGAC